METIVITVKSQKDKILFTALADRLHLKTRILSEENDFELLGTVNDGIEAFDFIRKKQPDILIADLSMPHMSGIELTQKLSELYPQVKVLILSMFNNEDYIFNDFHF